MKSSGIVIGVAAICVCVLTVAAADEPSAKPLRAGMIGLDTSHVPAFAGLFNAPNASRDLAGIRIVAAYPGGTDLPLSKNRVAKFTEDLRDTGVEIVETIASLLEKVDVVFLESVDGRIHLEEAIPVIMAGKPLFIDKPVAGSLVDAIAIFERAKQENVPCFSSSSIRFGAGIQELKKNESLGHIAGAETWGPCSYQDGIPDLFFYGIHGVEGLFALMGTGCITVARIQADDADVVVGTWKNGRVGTYRGLRRNHAESGAIAFGTKAIATTTKSDRYESLCLEIAKFFTTGTPPVTAEETIEIFEFMEAAEESKRQGGKPVLLADVLKKARLAVAAKAKPAP